jgi:hypothetical protein
MWDRRSMMPTCMAYSSRRWEVAKRIPGRHRECLFTTAEGPFPCVTFASSRTTT